MFEPDAPEDPAVPVLGDRLFGFDIEALPDGHIPIALVAIVAGLDAEGAPTISLRYNEGIQPWTMLGLLRAAKLTTDQDILGMWEYGADLLGEEEEE